MTKVAPSMQNLSTKTVQKEAWYSLSGDVNSDMVRRVFDAVAGMHAEGVTRAHVLIQSNGGFVSDGICLYNYLHHAPQQFVMYNCGAIASIAVNVFLAGDHRIASDTARFMVHRSHASPPSGARPEDLSIIVDGLRADDRRTEVILKRHVNLSAAHWDVHAHSDLHLTAEQALEVGMVHAIGDFAPPTTASLQNI